jgi:uncharacterized protein (DUF2141 family)
MIRARLAVLLAAMSLAPSARAAGVDVALHVTGIQPQKGEIFAGLYDAAGWRGERFLSGDHVAVSGPEVTLHLTAPGPGRYGVKLFQDLKGTGKLAKNLLGVPQEPYAFSNNAKGTMGPPGFDAAAFDVTAGGAQQDIRMR